MTILTPAEIRQVWLQAGGSSDRAIIAVAVALAESGGNTTAISPTGDYGLWQINRSNFGSEFSAIQWWDPIVNAQFAVRLSRNGTNWGDWCTTWVDPNKYCGRAELSEPQPGSPAYGKLQQLGADLISAPPRIDPGANAPDLGAAIHWIFQWSQTQFMSDAQRVRMAARRIADAIRAL